TVARGAHTLTVRFGAPGVDGRVLVGLDCLALLPLALPFVPEGALQPGQTYNQPIDQAAAAQVFRVPAGNEAHGQLSLTGLWQAARWDDPAMDAAPYAPITNLPRAAEYPLRWLGVPVPGNAFALRPELSLGHRFFYRTKVYLPPQGAPRAYRVHSDGSTWIVSVFVNGAFVGDHTSVLVPWDMDITAHMTPGATNQRVIGIKSPWHAIDVSDPRGTLTSLQHTRDMPTDRSAARNFMFVDAMQPSTKGEGDVLQVGLVNPVALIATGPVYVDDVVVRTRVAAGDIIAGVTVRNTLPEPTRVTVQGEAVYERSGGIEQLLGPVSVLVPAMGTAQVSITTAWANAKLWWPERDPHVYILRTLVRANTAVSDVQRTTFGFREISLQGRHFLLNGIPWHFWNWVDVGPRGANEAEWLARYEAQYDRFHRISDDHSRIFGPRAVALEKLDRLGIPGRLSTCIDGMFITHNLENPRTWSNFERHIRQVVTAWRNHPSIMMWSVGNELMLVTGRLRYGREYRRWEEATARLCALANELDPTRPSFEDGAGDLGGLAQMNCDHYGWQTGATFPRCAYAYAIGPAIEPRPVQDSAALYRWSGKNPYLFGEVFHYHAASDMSWFGGPRTYRGVAERDRAAARYFRIAMEGARWQDVTAVCPWTLALPAALKSCMPVAAFIREQNSLFYAGTGGVKRTIGIFNDTRVPRTFSLEWEQRIDGKDEFGGNNGDFVVQPGARYDTDIGLAFPRLTRRTPVTLWIGLREGTNLVFEDTRQLNSIPPPAALAPPTNALCVIAPAPALVQWLDHYAAVYTVMSATASVPAAAQVVLVAPDCLTKNNTPVLAPRLAAAAARGATIIVLEQDTPLQSPNLPAPGIAVATPRNASSREMAEFAVAHDYNGAIAHPTAPGHPVFANLATDDFFVWGSETLFKKSYLTPVAGALPLLQAGPALALAPLIEVPAGSGVYLLSQVLIGAHLGVEPAADHVLANALRWALARGVRPERQVALLAGADAVLPAWLDQLGVRYRVEPELRRVLQQRQGIAIVRATPTALAALVQQHARVQQFCTNGGWLMLVGLDTNGMAAFNTLVGRPHRLRRFGVERVMLDEPATPLAIGITDRDFAQFSDDMLAPWMQLYRRSDRVFTYVVDNAELAAFAAHADPRLTDGLDNREFWQYVVYFTLDPDSTDNNPRMNGRPIRLDFAFAQPATFTNIMLTINTTYQLVKEVKILFDDNEDTGLIFACAPHDAPQSFTFAPCTASKISIKVLSRYPGAATQALLGFDEISLPRIVPPAPDAPAIFITQPAGLVVYPRGAGGIVLNNLDYTETTPAGAPGGATQAAQNMAKKRAIMANVLRNMGAAFGAPPANVTPATRGK
ncbi:MAG: hypothetical protein NTV22_03110, partial [bacterium]|nr:hypothetical protein [bacterium]